MSAVRTIWNKIRKRMAGSSYIWILDNGHGAKTTDRQSPPLEDGTIFYEYEFNRAIVERLIAKLTEAEIDYIDLVPDYQDVGNFVMGRIVRANKRTYPKPAIYLSIHADAAPSNLCDEDGWAQERIHGATTFYGSNDGATIAARFVQDLDKDGVFKPRGFRRKVDKDGDQYYAVIRETKMVAVILELGFFNNKTEVVKLLSPEYRDKITETLFKTIQGIENDRPI